MDEDRIIQLLTERKFVLDQLEQVKQGYEEMKKRILTPELMAEVEAIEAECSETCKSASEKLSELETAIRAETVALGRSVKAEGFGHAVFVKGKTSWNTEGLMTRSKEEQYSWLQNYYTVGDPTCQIRK